MRTPEQAKGWFGGQIQDVSKEEAHAFGWENPRGAKAVKLEPGGPAEKAGVLPGDVLLSLDGEDAANTAAFAAAVSSKAPGKEVKLRLLRGGAEKLLTLAVGARPAEQTRAEPGGVPILRLDTGGHMAVIKAVAFTLDGKYVVSAGDDKVIRVWDWRAGKTVRTIRGQSGPADEGKIYAIALSPDDRWLVVAGFTGPNLGANNNMAGDIRLYDFASGQLKAVLKGHRDAVSGLAFSPDGKKLISGSADKSAIVWDIETQTLLHRLEGHRGPIYAVGFTPDGQRAVTGSVDKTLRLWKVADGALIKEMTGHGDKVRSLAVSPSDGSIASCDWSGEIRYWDGKTGAPGKVLAYQGATTGSLRFSRDGSMLLSTCNLTQHVYSTVSGMELAAYKKHGGAVVPGAFSSDGSLVATGGGDNQEIHIWDPKTGETKAVLKGKGHPGWAVGFAADGRGIAWGNTRANPPGATPINDRGPLQMALRLPGGDAAVLGEPQPLRSAERWVRASASFGTLSLRHRRGGVYDRYNAILDLMNNGQPTGISIERSSSDGFGHSSYGFTPDGKQIVSGGSGYLSAYGLDGKKLGNFVGHEGEVWAVAFSPDGRYLVSGANDQTVRLWNLKTREPLVTIFRGEDGEWVIWTPQGYYASSAAGASLIGWQINRSPASAAEYVAAAQLRNSMHRPDILARAIQLASAEAAAKEGAGTHFQPPDLANRPAPRFHIVSPAANAALTGGKVDVLVALEATPDPVKLVRIQVNGRQIAEHMPTLGAGFAPGSLSFPVPLGTGQNTIRVIAVNQTGESTAAVTVGHAGAGSLDKRGTLYILAIGVDKYRNFPDRDLRYSGADAKAFTEAMQRAAGPLHERVVARVLVNGASPADTPTAANILDALTLLHEAQENDTIMVFLAGHGISDGPNYRFLATDTAASSGGTLKPSTIVPWYALQEAIESAKGRRILFLDTCHSGSAINRRLGTDAYQANVIVYSAARWDQLAAERDDLGGGHGVFTFATIEGVAGKADITHSGQITTLNLRDFLVSRVRELARPLNHDQEPQYFRGRDADNYVLVQK